MDGNKVSIQLAVSKLPSINYAKKNIFDSYLIAETLPFKVILDYSVRRYKTLVLQTCSDR
jgi:hypothetical protein